MKKQLLALTFGIVGALVPASFVVAAENQSAFIAVSKVLQNLEAQGYVGVREVELDNGVYKADVVSTNGSKQDVEINAMSGMIAGPKNLPNHFSSIDIAKKVEQAGYQIIKMESDGDTYKIRGLDREGKKKALKVNAMTDEITKKWFN